MEVEILVLISIFLLHSEVPSVTGSDTRSRSSKEEGGSSTKKPRIEPPASLDADDVIDDDDVS